MRSQVTYTKDQRQKAKEQGNHLVCISALGVTFTGPVKRETAVKLLEWATKNILSKPEV